MSNDVRATGPAAREPSPSEPVGARQRHRAGPGAVGDDRRSSRRRSTRPAAWRPVARRRPLLQPLRQPDGAGLRGGHRRTSRGPRRRGRSPRAWARVTTVVSASARPATTSSPSASSTPAPSCCCRRPCPRFGIDVTFVDGTEPGALRRGRAARAGRCWCRRDAGQPAARPRRPGRARRHHGPGDAGRLDLRHAARPAAPRPRRRPGAALGHQGHRRPQRRHPRRGRRASRADRLALGLRRAPGGQRLAVRRHERPAGPAHARRCASPARARRPSAWPRCSRPHPAVASGALPGPGVAPPARPGQAADAPTAARCCRSTWPVGSRPGRRFVEGVRLAQLATSLGGPETLVSHPADSTHVGLAPEELAAAGIGPGPGPRLGRPRARRRPPGRLPPGPLAFAAWRVSTTWGACTASDRWPPRPSPTSRCSTRSGRGAPSGS